MDEESSMVSSRLENRLVSLRLKKQLRKAACSKKRNRMRGTTYFKEQSDGMRRAALVRAQIGKEKKAD